MRASFGKEPSIILTLKRHLRRKEGISGAFFDVRPYHALPAWYFVLAGKEKHLETRIAAISIIVQEPGSVEALNATLHEYAPYVLGRMGIPYREKGVNIICIAMDAPADTINALTGKIGRLPGVSAKAAYASR